MNILKVRFLVVNSSMLMRHLQNAPLRGCNFCMRRVLPQRLGGVGHIFGHELDTRSESKKRKSNFCHVHLLSRIQGGSKFQIELWSSRRKNPRMIPKIQIRQTRLRKKKLTHHLYSGSTYKLKVLISDESKVF